MAGYGSKEVSLSGKIKRYPRDERRQLEAILQSHGWQSLVRDFRIKTCTDVRREHLAAIAEGVDDACPDFKIDVKSRMELVKRMHGSGKVQVYKGGSREGSRRAFYRYYMFVQANACGTYDVFLASLCRKEEEKGFFGELFGLIGKALLFVLFPQPMMFAIVHQQVLAQSLLKAGIFADDEDSTVTPAALLMLSHGKVPEALGDKIIEFEFVEDLIDKGFLIPNGDGAQMTLKFE